MRKLTIALVALALALAACANAPEEHHEDETVHGMEVEVWLNDFSINYLSEPFNEGDIVTFVATNNGSVAHEFEVTGEAGITGHLEGGHNDHGDMVMGDKLMLDPGETGELTVTITHDANIAVCLIPGHYEAGMWIPLTVEDHG